MKTAEVFGVSNEQIASYIEREEVDARFLEGLERNKHIIGRASGDVDVHPGTLTCIRGRCLTVD